MGASLRSRDDSLRIENYLTTLFTNIAVYVRTEEDIPGAAFVYLRDSVIDIFNDTIPIKSLHITKVNLTFYGGSIEKVQVLGSMKLKDNSIPIEFNNRFSIGISSTRNVQGLSNINLFSDRKFSKKIISEMEKDKIKTFTDEQVSSGHDKKSLKIKLGDLLGYEKILDVNANDISPIDIKITLDRENQKIKVNKEPSSRLFEAKLYTDLLGLINEENPNGIAQLEMDKRFNINNAKGNAIMFKGGGTGFFQYIDASFSLSKLEADNKYLIPTESPNSSGLYVFHPIQLYHYRNYSVGAMLNLWSHENQNFKVNANLDAGVLFGRTGIKSDSSEFASKFFVNNVEFPIEAGVQFVPEKRVKFSINDRVSWFRQLSDQIEVIDMNKDFDKGSNDDSDLNTDAWLNTLTMKLEVNISPSGNGRLFARYKFTHELGYWQNNFSQLQFGYSFFILKNNGVNKAIRND
ncbi:MAG: hypothetical protein JXR65_10100 [Bacteroidales bacterium]|nr:hypothetical protein [Bacteroidales bacterium]